jgi:hypothetical protein
MDLSLAALIVLLLILAYLADLRARYIDVFYTYGASDNPGCPSPWKIALAIERPWAQKLFMARPIEAPIATFALYLVRAKGADLTSLCYGFAPPQSDHGAALDAWTLRPQMGGNSPPTNAQLCAAWNTNNPMAGAPYFILWDSPIVNMYRGFKATTDSTTTIVKFPLEILYGAGFLSLASLVTTESSTSMDDLWTLCFSEQVPIEAKKPPQPADPCATAGAHAASGAMGGAGIGLMIAAAALPPPANIFALLVGAIIGGSVGALGTVLSSGQACCISKTCPTAAPPERQVRAGEPCGTTRERMYATPSHRNTSGTADTHRLAAWVQAAARRNK